MRRTILVLSTFLSVVAFAPPARSDCNDPFGKPNEVLDFYLRLKRADWSKLLASTVRNVDNFGGMVDSPACADKFPKFPAEFRCGADGPWLKIGVRKKKGTERGVEAPEKPPLKLDFNEDFMGAVPDAMGQRWPASMGDLGFRKLTLNNGQGNKPADVPEPLLLPVLLTEHVALRLLKREVPSSPATAYAKVTLHFEGEKPEGEYHGVYILVEDIDRTAVKRRWGQGKGKLIKASTPDCSPEVQFDDGPPNGALAAFDAWMAKDPAKFSGTWLQESVKGVDLDAALRQEAIREILVNGNDTLFNSRAYLEWGKWGMGNNWLAYDPPAGVRQYMPWDVDLTFGNQNNACAPSKLACGPDFRVLDWCNTMPLTPATVQTKSKIGLATACNTEIQKRYLEVMCQLTNGPLSAAEILKLWNEADRAIRPVIPLEKDFIWKGRDPLSTTTFKSYGSEFERMKKWIPERTKSVQQQITRLGVPCSPGCPAGAKDSCSYLGCPGERRCENNAWTECRQVDGACPPKPSGRQGPDGGITADGGAAPDGGMGPDGNASSSDSSVPSDKKPDARPRVADGAGGAAESGGGEPQPSPDAAAGCACAIGRESRPSGVGLAAFAILAVALRQKRRRSANDVCSGSVSRGDHGRSTEIARYSAASQGGPLAPGSTRISSDG